MPKRKKSWKSVQSSSKTNHRTKLGFVILGMIVLVVFLGRGFQIVSNLFKPLDNNVQVGRSYTFDGSSNINILVHGDSYGVISYNPIDRIINILEIPGETYITVPGGYGEWQVKSIYGLGESAEKSLDVHVAESSAPDAINEQTPISGNSLLVDSITNFLAMPLDGYIEVKGELSELSILQITENIRKSPLGFTLSMQDLRSNMTLVDLGRFSWSLGQVRFDKVKEINLEKLLVLEKTRLPDNSEVLGVDYSRLDIVLQGLADNNIAGERLSVAVYNATSMPGLAQKYARLISNLGANVITVNNAESRREKTLVVPNPNNLEEVINSYTFKKLSNIFSLGCQGDLKCDKIDCKSTGEEVDCKVNDNQMNLSRAQINIILGEDITNNF